MIATSVAGRGLDVPEIVCVVNYHCPNHLEDYVHRVGRTGRAGRKGTAYTFISSKEEAFAPIMIKALKRAHIEPAPELIALGEQFAEKVARGEAKYAKGGFGGDGFKFDASEMNDAQRMAAMQRKAYDIEMGLVNDEQENFADDEDGDDDDVLAAPQATNGSSGELPGTSTGLTTAASGPPTAVSMENLTPMERAKLVAQSILAPTQQPLLVPPVPGSLALSHDAVESVMLKAAMVARQITSKDKPVNHFADNFEINDYPAQVSLASFFDVHLEL